MLGKQACGLGKDLFLTRGPEGFAGGSFGWFLLGILIGGALLAAAYVYVTRERAEPPVPLAPPAPAPAPGAGPPPRASPAPALPSAAPHAAAPAAPAAGPTDEERQIADDAAATGMTGPAIPPPEQPTY